MGTYEYTGTAAPLGASPNRMQTTRTGRPATWVAFGGIFVDAYDFTSFSVGTAQLKVEFGLTSSQLGLLSGVIAVGALLGSSVGGLAADRFGRRPVFTFSLGLCIIASLISATTHDVLVLAVLRFLLGFAVGVDFPVALSYVAETAKTSKRGMWVNLTYANWYLAALVGFCASYLAVAVFGVNDGLWRYSVAFGALPAAIVLVSRYLFLPESPQWSQVEARGAVTSHRWRLHTVTSLPYRPRLLLAGFVGCFQSIEYYAVMFYLPLLVTLVRGKDLTFMVLAGATYSLIGLIGSATQALLTHRWGVRRLTIAGSILAFFGSLTTGWAIHADQLAGMGVGLGIFFIGHVVGPGPQGMAYATLSFPTIVRGTAVGLAQSALRVGSLIGLAFLPPLVEALGPAPVFAALAIIPLAVGIAAAASRWEPTNHDVEAEFEMLSTGVSEPAARLR